MPADSAGNGHRLKAISPSIPQGAFWGVLVGQKFRNLGTLLNGWTDCHQILHMSADSPGNRHKLNKLGR